jgi:hypothetical protein
MTLLTEGHVPDAVYASAREHFSEAELVDLAMAVVAINGWNRLMVGFRGEAGAAVAGPSALSTRVRGAGSVPT